MKKTTAEKLTFRPLTRGRWRDLERLFGERGACGGCWCMWWRVSRAQYEKQKGAGNKRALRKIVASGQAPGLLAYAGRQPVGWCSVAPRANFPVLDRSRVLKAVDDKPVWSVVCLFVDKAWRRRGVSVALLRAAADYVRKHGGRIVEGYPVEPKSRWPDAFLSSGLPPAYRRAGFKEVARRSPTRPVMRRLLRRR
ncbi:MAG: GNAT family N-acetyltransferase [Terriglobia bacterium]